MTDVTIQPASADVYISASATDYNYNTGGDGEGLHIGEHNAGTQHDRRALIKFDLTSIPSGATLTSAVLSLYAIEDNSWNSSNVDVYRLLRAFVEGQATWNIAATGTSWGTAGADNTTSDREASYIGTKALTATETMNAWKSWTLDNDAIAEMCGNSPSFTNNGFLLRSRAENADSYRYASSSNSTSENRPKLEITYEQPFTGLTVTRTLAG